MCNVRQIRDQVIKVPCSRQWSPLLFFTNQYLTPYGMYGLSWQILIWTTLYSVNSQCVALMFDVRPYGNTHQWRVTDTIGIKNFTMKHLLAQLLISLIRMIRYQWNDTTTQCWLSCSLWGMRAQEPAAVKISTRGNVSLATNFRRWVDHHTVHPDCKMLWVNVVIHKG